MKRISTGIENFKEIIDHDYYYVDKTEFLEDVFSDKVMLYTRPRRFGKTLNLSMLYYFFSNKEKDNAYLFDGLKITKNKALMKHQNQYPVIFMTLKDLSRENMQLQIEKYKAMIAEIVVKNIELLDSDVLDQSEKDLLQKYRFKNATESDLRDALYNISIYLNKHYHQKVIIMIDEYDVPLQTAYMHGYYDEMTVFMKNVFSSALKTNNALERGILTGCLRIAKESIFTGLNNFTVRAVTDQYGSHLFGFTQTEIDDLLSYYHLDHKREEMKSWYDGYLFGNTEIYNPWSSMKYVQELLGNKDYPASSFWANTSGNDIVRKYIANSNLAMKEEFEKLINGQSIIKRIKPELTYREMKFETKEDMNDDIYSFLLYTGYLKIQDKVYDELTNTYHLVIPNREVKTIYENHFMEWFEQYKKTHRNDFIDKLSNGNEKEAQKILNDVLKSSISYYDNYESFYHGFMIGFLKADGYEVKSNQESGEGRFDMLIIPNEIDQIAIIIECKHSISTATLKKDSQKATKQIKEKNYVKSLYDRGYENVMGYGISFFKKQCYITKL